MAEKVVLSAMDERGIATLTLNRPDVHNAYNGAMIEALVEEVGAFAADPRVRLLILRANGRHFQAGADLAWLREVAGSALEDNVAFSRRTTLAMRALNAFPRPTLALVQGACYGGGVGMVACCDVAIASAVGALCADRGALGRDPGADHPAVVRGDGRAQPPPLSASPASRSMRRRRGGSG